MSRGVLLIEAGSGEFVDGVVLCGSAGVRRKQIEHAGASYQRRLAGDDKPDPAAAALDEPPAESDRSSEPLSAEQRAADLRRMVSGKDDFYELLNLGQLRWRATEDDIRKAFRKMSLQYHPDKLRQHGSSGALDDANHPELSLQQKLESSDTDPNDIEELFKKIRMAYDTLSDKKKRAAYDSIDDFDDSIPTWNPKAEYAKRPDEFYSRFGRCFDLNARWSTSSRVPKLGDDNSSDAEIDKFYDFWMDFKSWREFSMDQEYDPDQAESRDERRWIERQNAKHAKALKVDETARIRNLVETAYKFDPRILRQKEAERKAKEDAKRKKLEERQAVENAARQESERLEKESQEREAAEKLQRTKDKREKEKMKKALQRARRRLRDSCAGCGEDALIKVELACGTLSAASLEGLAETIETTEDKSNAAHTIQSWIDNKDDHSAPKVANGSPAQAKGEVNKTKPQEKEWEMEELSMLSKALNKFPGGTRDRWVRVSEYMITRDPDECLKKANELRDSAVKPAVTNVDAFERFQQKKKPSATGSLDPSDAPGAPTKATANGHNQLSAEPNGPPNVQNFSKKQQTLLEESMKKFPMSMGSERWVKVAAAVPGRSPQECQARFKELVTYFKSKK